MIHRNVYLRLPRDRATLRTKSSNGYNGYRIAAVAQLVEHLPSKQDVAGSNPVRRSTPPPPQFQALPLPNAANSAHSVPAEQYPSLIRP